MSGTVITSQGPLFTTRGVDRLTGKSSLISDCHCIAPSLFEKQTRSFPQRFDVSSLAHNHHLHERSWRVTISEDHTRPAHDRSRSDFLIPCDCPNKQKTLSQAGLISDLSKVSDRSCSVATEAEPGMPQKSTKSDPEVIKSQDAPRFTVTQPLEKGEDSDHQEDQDFSESTSDGEGQEVTESAPKTAAERLAEKRRMKRFRLTHSQTRYLMNEFSRQPNPDAAHREKLSSEIPGLSPRQVQVWFQNRRAKMKRLTGDDQERMMRSRAVPRDVDLLSTLHPGVGEQYQNVAYSSGTVGPVDARPFRAPGQVLGSSQTTEAQSGPPINTGLVYRNPSFSMGPAGSSSHPSPVSSINESTAFSDNQSPTFMISRNASPFQMSGSFQRAYGVANPSTLVQNPRDIVRGGANSLAGISPRIPSQTFPPVGLRSSQSSYEALRESFQTLETQNNPSHPVDRPFERPYGDLAQFRATTLPVAGIPLSYDQQDPDGQSSSYLNTLGINDAPISEHDSQAMQSWPLQTVVDQAPHPELLVQAEYGRRLEMQTADPSSYAATAQSNVSHQQLFQPVYLQGQMPHYDLSGQPAPSSMYLGGDRRPSFQATASSPSASDEQYQTREHSISQSPGYPPYYTSPPQ